MNAFIAKEQAGLTNVSDNPVMDFIGRDLANSCECNMEVGDCRRGCMYCSLSAAPECLTRRKDVNDDVVAAVGDHSQPVLHACSPLTTTCGQLRRSSEPAKRIALAAKSAGHCCN